MQKQQSRVIINISTFAAFEPDPTFPTPGVFRAGLPAFTKLIAFSSARNSAPHYIEALSSVGLHFLPRKMGEFSGMFVEETGE
jgi:hypothetical protein